MESDEPEGANPSGTRWLRRRIPAAVAAVTVRVETGFRATSVSAFMIASIDPPQLLVSLDRFGQMVEWIEERGSFAISILTQHDRFLADRFAGFAPLVPESFEGVPYHVAETGAPILEGAVAWAECQVAGRFETGDHTCVLGDIVAIGAGSADPHDALLYFLGRYRGLDELRDVSCSIRQ